MSKNMPNPCKEIDLGIHSPKDDASGSISPLGFYTPYVPLQVSNIFKKDEKMTNCPECSTGVLQETSFIEEGKTVEVIGCNRCRYSDFNVVERENDIPTRSPAK